MDYSGLTRMNVSREAAEWGNIPPYLPLTEYSTIFHCHFLIVSVSKPCLQSWRKPVCKTRSRPQLKTQFVESHRACGVIRTLPVQSEGTAFEL